MEAVLSLAKKHIVFFVLLFLLTSLEAQQTIRFTLWAHIEPLPSAEIDISEDPLEFAITDLKEQTRFLIEAMLSGWNFSYTPYDKARNVSEYFEFTPVTVLAKDDKRLTFDVPTIEENRLHVWTNYALSADQEKRLNSWQSSQFPRIQGSGQGSFFAGAEGLEQAYSNAIKAAVRSHAQGLVKNKPKEVNGTVLLAKPPHIRVISGKYVVDVVLYVSVKEIIPYRVF